MNKKALVTFVFSFVFVLFVSVGITCAGNTTLANNDEGVQIFGNANNADIFNLPGAEFQIGDDYINPVTNNTGIGVGVGVGLSEADARAVSNVTNFNSDWLMNSIRNEVNNCVRNSLHQNQSNVGIVKDDSKHVNVLEVNIPEEKVATPDAKTYNPGQIRPTPRDTRYGKVTEDFGTFRVKKYDPKTHYVVGIVTVDRDTLLGLRNPLDKINLTEVTPLLLKMYPDIVKKYGINNVRYRIWWEPKNLSIGVSPGSAASGATTAYGATSQLSVGVNVGAVADRFTLEFLIVEPIE